MKFYKAETGEITAVRADETFDAAGMTEIIPNTTDAAKEKHVPVLSREGQTVTVTVGSAAHPMLDNHWLHGGCSNLYHRNFVCGQYTDLHLQ